ncbi:MAG: HAD-IB family hydrolase, partial [Patescibacteria group bacterium]
KLWEIPKNELVDTIYLEQEIKKRLPKSYFTEKSVPHCLQGVRAAFFDLDDTLTRRNVFIHVTERYLLGHPDVHVFGKLLLALFKGLTMRHGYFYRAAMRSLRGVRVAEFLRGYRAHLHHHKHELFHPQMLELLESHRQKGNCVFIISEEPQDILDPIAELLGVPCFGTELEKKQGVFTGEVAGHIMKDEYKRDKVVDLAHKYGIDLEKSYAYGDSRHDYAMLRSVGHAALINPSSTYGKKCKRLGMRIIRV